MLRTILCAISAVFVGGQSPSAAPSRPPPAPLSFMDTTKIVPTGNYTLGYINNTVENDCHIATVKFQSLVAGQVSQFSFGAFSQAANETCGIGFTLKTFPGAVAVGTGVTALFSDVAMPTLTIEMMPFPVPATSLWNLEANANYTITIQPFTWAGGNTAGGGVTSAAVHCSFDVPYGFAGVPQNGLIGYHGPTGLPCGSTPLTVNKAGDGYSLLMKLKGAPLPSPSPSPTPSTTSTLTPTPTGTGTPTPTPTPTGTPSNTETPTQTLSPGATASNSATNSRTPSRTPSISYSSSPTPTETPSQTPTTTPTPTTTLSFRASPSVTPTETPGPTDSNSPTPTPSAKTLVGIVAPVVVQAPTITTGHIVAAVCGGVALAIMFIGIAVRYRAVSIQINGPKKVKSWKPTPTTEINHNPLVIDTKFKRTKFEMIPV